MCVLGGGSKKKNRHSRIKIKEYVKIKIKLMHNNKISIYSVSNKIRQQMNSFMYQIEFGISLTW